MPPEAELQWWYQYYFATERGRPDTTNTGTTSPSSSGSSPRRSGDFDDATFDRTAASFDNPDHVAIVIHNYRWRLGLADGEPQYDALESSLPRSRRSPCRRSRSRAMPTARRIPTCRLRRKFSGKYAHRIITGGIGHNLPQEAPRLVFVQAIDDVDSLA